MPRLEPLQLAGVLLVPMVMMQNLMKAMEKRRTTMARHHSRSLLRRMERMERMKSGEYTNSGATRSLNTSATEEPATEAESGEPAAMEINMEQVPAPTPAQETPTSPPYIEREDLQDAGDDDIELLLKSGYAIGADRMSGQII
ncbi:hypothetical protein R1sor_021963 [Riccia sorocarpa]|uniref:Uncharacterized protein n=1 Tax=Riccia sorocarpa TaxID=122646 RepID=A0ABD3GIG9_9MARC